jgi:hypothetical protein
VPLRIPVGASVEPSPVLAPAPHRAERDEWGWGRQVAAWGALLALIALAWWI